MDLEALARELAGFDVNVADQAELSLAVSLSGKARAWLDAFDVGVARRAAVLAAGGPAAAGAAVTDTLSDRGRRSRREAKAAAERAGVCERMPGVEAALAAGHIASGHVDAIANATKNLDEAGKAEFAGFTDDLLAAAATKPVGVFERECRDLAAFVAKGDGTEELERQRRQRSCTAWVDKVSGMHHLHAQLDAEAGAKLMAALNAQLTSLCADKGNAGVAMEALRADALCALIQPTTADGDRAVPEVSVLVDARTLFDGLHEHSLCETVDGVRLPVATVRRMCCDAEILPIVLDGHGEVLDCGRSRRTASRPQRRALAALYRTCAHPDCDVAFSLCEIHHVDWWEHLGPTDLANLVPTCGRHHHLVHEGGWQLTMTPDRVVTLTRPDGTIHVQGRTCDRWPPDLPVPRSEHDVDRALRARRTIAA